MSHVHVSVGEDRIRGQQPQRRAERTEAHVPDARAALAVGAGVLRLQRMHGNRHVVGLLAARRDAEGDEGLRQSPEEQVDLEHVIEEARGSGRPMDAHARSRMESAFGADFAAVRIHTGSEAHAMNMALGANAFTHGHDVFFRDGAYQPGTSNGRRLLAHELTHVVQQQGGVRPSLVVGPAGDRFEREADRVADTVEHLGDHAAAASPRLVDQRGEASPRIQRQGGVGGAIAGALRSVFYTARAFVPNHIRASSTPDAMAQDRIPPRVDTPVWVGVIGLSALGTPVTFSVEHQSAANGTVTIDGAATADRRVVGRLNLRGVGQTAPGNAGHLQLVARQGATELARSGGFSVSSIPQNWSVAFHSDITGDPTKRGLRVTNSWQSDSRNIADLNQAERSESVQPISASGPFNMGASHTSGYLAGTLGSVVDTHSTPPGMVTGTGSRVVQQTFKFKDKRTGATDIPATNSGYKISRVATARASVGGVAGSALWAAGETVQSWLGLRGGFFLATSKYGSGGTAHGITSSAASGSARNSQVV